MLSGLELGGKGRWYNQMTLTIFGCLTTANCSFVKALDGVVDAPPNYRICGTEVDAVNGCVGHGWKSRI